MVTEEDVLDVLNTTTDPELGIGIVDLGLVARCAVSEDYVRIAIRTTTPRCPFQPFIMMEAHRRLLLMDGVSGAEVEIDNSVPWRPQLMSEDAKERLGFSPSRLGIETQIVPEIHVPADRS